MAFDIPGDFSLNIPALNIPDIPDINIPSIPEGGWDPPTGFPTNFTNIPTFSPPSGPGWLTNASNFATKVAPIINVGKDVAGGGLGIKSIIDNAKYQRAVAAWQKQQAAQAAAYNAAQLDYLKQRQAWESQVQGMFSDFFSQFEEGFAGFQAQIQSIVDQQTAAAAPLIQQGLQLTKEGTAALAKGEVPPELEPVFAQIRARARAAAEQQFASAGIDSGTADAAITQQIDAQTLTSLLALASGQITQGEGQLASGQGFLGAAESGVALSFDPIAKEFGALQSLMGSMFGGGSPTLAPTPPPVAPVA